MGYLGPHTDLGGEGRSLLLLNWLDTCSSGPICCRQYLLLSEAGLHFLRQPLPGSSPGLTNWFIWHYYWCKFNRWYVLLQVILSRMILDICKFCFLYVLVLFAFSCGKNFILKLSLKTWIGHWINFNKFSQFLYIKAKCSNT